MKKEDEPNNWLQPPFFWRRSQVLQVHGAFMKQKFDKHFLKQVGFVLVFLALAPFSIEIVLIADVAGIEFAVTFMAVYYRAVFADLVERWWRFKNRFSERLGKLAELVLFQPSSYGLTATASCLIIVLTGSTLVACSVWLPAMAMSSGFI
ncbi:MAG: hypothetical protein JJ956_07340 [Pseudomonadales bacterium]|nr:hypothetical protein [Pseudomonadales bacterium]